MVVLDRATARVGILGAELAHHPAIAKPDAKREADQRSQFVGELAAVVGLSVGPLLEEPVCHPVGV
ncbi:MAG TPA: hypothetical protein VG276_14990 [Actinomycetes bacterium]|nr:hypothetical protein [Actinomycetes bacterium]